MKVVSFQGKGSALLNLTLCKACEQRLVNSSVFVRYQSVGRKRNHYEVLGVLQTATHEEIKAAYLEKSKKLHPDQNKDTTSHDQFLEMKESYEVVGNKLKRQEYDQRLRGFSSVRQKNPQNYYSSGAYSQNPYYDSRYGNYGPYSQANQKTDYERYRESRFHLRLIDLLLRRVDAFCVQRGMDRAEFLFKSVAIFIVIGMVAAFVQETTTHHSRMFQLQREKAKRQEKLKSQRTVSRKIDD